MYNHNKAQQSKNRVHISWDILLYADDTWNHVKGTPQNCVVSTAPAHGLGTKTSAATMVAKYLKKTWNGSK